MQEDGLWTANLRKTPRVRGLGCEPRPLTKYVNSVDENCVCELCSDFFKGAIASSVKTRTGR